jgi:hypothetical protein
VALISIAFLAVVAVGASVLVGRRLGSTMQAVLSGLLITVAAHLALIAFYSALAVANFDGLCRPLLQAPRRCSIFEHLAMSLEIVAVGTSPMIPVLFVITTVAGVVAMRFGTGSPAAGDRDAPMSTRAGHA